MTSRLSAVRAVACALLLIPSVAAAQTGFWQLPLTAPVPEARPGAADATSAGAGANSERQQLPDTGTAPVPEQRAIEAADQEDEGAVSHRQIRRSVGRHNSRNAAHAASLDGQAESACQRRLSGLGAAFSPQPPVSEAPGCSLPHPLVVSRLSADIAIAPPAMMTCGMAEAAALFARDVVSPTAQSVYGSAVTSLAGTSGYTCRSRKGSTKLSEHAFGNALDISSFVLADGTSIEVGSSKADEKARRFLARIRTAACGPFKTVLGPGSDADHADHLHFDLAARRGGSTFCQ